MRRAASTPGRFVLFRVTPVMLLLVFGFLAFVKVQYGMGKPYPDIGSASLGDPSKLEKFIRLDYPPGNLAVAANGHVYFNYHPIARTDRFSPATVFEWADGKITPFPSMEMQKEFQGTFGMTIDRQNRIWFIEPAVFDFQHTRLSAFDLQTRQRVEFFEFPAHEAQFAQDLRVTADGKYVLLADPGILRFTEPKLIVYSVQDHSFRTALAGSPCMSPEDWLMQTPYGPYRLLLGLINAAVGLDGIEISKDQNWVYLAAMTHSRLCRVPLAAVLDSKHTPSSLAQKLEDLGPKSMSDGITEDKAGHIIVTDVEHGGIMAFDPNTRSISSLVRSRDVIWPDGVMTGPDDSIYFTDSAIPAYVSQFGQPPSKAQLLAHQPYSIYRLRR